MSEHCDEHQRVRPCLPCIVDGCDKPSPEEVQRDLDILFLYVWEMHQGGDRSIAEDVVDVLQRHRYYNDGKVVIA